jgi:hypothetical protein
MFAKDNTGRFKNASINLLMNVVPLANEISPADFLARSMGIDLCFIQEDYGFPLEEVRESPALPLHL